MTEAKTATSPKKIKSKTNLYFFPKENISINAETELEALEILKKNNKK